MHLTLGYFYTGINSTDMIDISFNTNVNLYIYIYIFQNILQLKIKKVFMPLFLFDSIFSGLIDFIKLLK